MANNLQYINPKNLLTVTAAGATATSAAGKLDLDDIITVCLNVTALLNTSPTLDIVMQHSIDGGTTYVNAPFRFAQVTAAGVHYQSFRLGVGDGEAAYNQAGVADTGGALAKNFVFDPRFVKWKYTIGGSGAGGMTFTITQFSVPRSGT